MHNYQTWGASHTTWYSPDAFCSQNHHADGVHTVTKENFSVNLLLQSDPLQTEYDFIPVFFGGATANRAQLNPPFFSGVALSKNLRLPSICVSDPVVENNQEVNLAWYAGVPETKFQMRLTELFKAIAVNSGKKLLFIGGSGGGFASLYYSVRLPEYSGALVWNPQTSILNYYSDPVQRFFAAIGAPSSALQTKNWKSEVREWRKGLVDVELWGSHFLDGNQISIILQNRTDWHLEKHFLPWISSTTWKQRDTPEASYYAKDDIHLAAVADFAEGHSPIPLPILNKILSAVIIDKKTAATAVSEAVKMI
ncbi:hypothetical protein [Rothia nasimurium]|uniref:hypothetical protein n=1 Tax=Rothia nasimurium TaxID=85336 RepID=UPI001F34975C|nr:hypothetical protein [Rothia nasimurium]